MVKSLRFRHGLMALIGTALALVLVSFFKKQREKNGSGQISPIKRMADDMGQGVAEAWTD